MNYFGLFFTFMIPGILMGLMLACVLRESITEKQRAQRKKQRPMPVMVQPVQGKLYVYNLREDLKSAA